MTQPTGNENIQLALTYGESLCWNESIGYNRFGSRALNPNVDCSSFVWYCLTAGGFDVTDGGTYSASSPWNTQTMIPVLQGYQGFTWFIYDGTQQLVEGDIFVYDEGGGANGHTFFVANNRRGYNAGTWDTVDGTITIQSQVKIEASGEHNHPEDGDQDNGLGAHTEVWVHGYTGSPVYGSHTWYVFRWSGGQPTTNIKPWLLAKIMKERRNKNNGFFYY